MPKDKETERKEISSYQIIAGMVADIIFEYKISTDLMTFRRCRNGEFGKPVEFGNLKTVIEKLIYTDDLTIFYHFLQELKEGKSKAYVELRIRLSDSCQWYILEGKIVSGMGGKMQCIVGRACAIEGRGSQDSKFYNTDYRDPLTRLLKRSSCMEMLSVYYHEIPEEKSMLIILDADDFYRINERMGHLFGDEVLINVADAISQYISGKDLAGRIGGDKFLVCIRGIKDREDAGRQAEGLQKVINKIYAGENLDGIFTTSMGIALYPEDSDNFEDLMNRAIMAMEFSKNTHKGAFYFWNENLERLVQNQQPRKGEKIIYTTFEKKQQESCDSFGYELSELAFLLMEEETDTESIINLMLRKVADHYDLSAVCIRECITGEYAFRVSYQYLRKDYFRSDLGREIRITKKQWDYFKNFYEEGFYYFEADKAGKDAPAAKYKTTEQLQTLLQIPLYRKKQFIGCIDYCDAYLSRKWSHREIQTLKSFSRIIADFLLNMRDYQDTTDKMEQLQEQDSLTGLLRYNVFQTKLQELINLPLDYRICLIYSDIRHFKFINENFGNTRGDAMIRDFAEKMAGFNEHVLLASRVYSDNIVIAIRLGNNENADELKRCVDCFNEKFAAEAEKKYENSSLKINSGIYIIQASDDAERAISNASFARKRAKAHDHRATTVVFTDSMMETIRKQMQLSAALPEAIRNHELCVYFQSKVECRTGNVVGAEALVRWKKSDGTVIYPDEFIPVFEKNGSIIEVDYFVYREVFSWLRKRLDAGETVVPVSMNVSRVHLSDSAILSYIRKLMEEYNIPASLLEFELTESLYIENLDGVLPLIIEMRQMGIKVAMDDFGSGFSSLNVLNNIPIDILKLDKVFMKKDTLDEGEKIILSCVVEMAKRLHITVLCEGVENEGQDYFLRHIGCDIIQGYLYSRPVSIRQFEDMLAQTGRKPVSCIRFPFHMDLKDTRGEYEGEMVGISPVFADGPKQGMMALYFPGNITPAATVLRLPGSIYRNDSYTITFWAKEEVSHIWTSIFYTSYRNGFSSLMLHGMDQKALYRIKPYQDNNLWCDAGFSCMIGKEWNYYCISYNAVNQTMEMKINGKDAGFYHPAPVLYPAEQILLGGDIFQQCFQGWISDFRIYDAVLSSRDIQKLMKENVL